MAVATIIAAVTKATATNIVMRLIIDLASFCRAG
jgi:hypothetical protein